MVHEFTQRFAAHLLKNSTASATSLMEVESYCLEGIKPDRV